MNDPFRIDAQDAEFVARVPSEDWPAVFAFRDRATFPNCVGLYAEFMVPYFSYNFVLNKVVGELWRFLMLVFALHLYDTRDPDDPHSGLTIGNFQKLCARQGIASNGRALAYLHIMQMGGYLTRSRSPVHGRIVHYAPTPAFIATVEGWNDGVFQLIDAVVPEDRMMPRRADYPDLGKEMRRRSAERLLGGWDPVAPFPEMELFSSSDGGWMVLSFMVAETLKHGFGQPVAIDLEGLSKQAGVSRSHLRRVLESAYKAGLLEAPPRNGANLMPSATLVRAFLAWLASYLGSYRLRTLEALAAWRPEGAPTV